MQTRELSAEASEMARSEEGRHFLSYLVSTALGRDQSAYALVDGRRHEFAGDLGLAPDWLDRPLTPDEERWVSAGILARINAFGQRVQISLRHPDTPFASLRVDEREGAEFTLYEGDFFGNLFAVPPVACVAAAPRPPELADDPILDIRVGTEIDKARTSLVGRPVTRCGFLLTGSTDDPDCHSVDGERYDQYLSVYLKPGEPRLAAVAGE